MSETKTEVITPDEVLERGEIALDRLKPHERNYREHPEDQLREIEESLRQHGVYRNVVIARDDTILAGHGVWKAATRLGLTVLPFTRLDLDPSEPKALKVLTGDNELSRLADVDDRALSILLREIKETDLDGLIGTGFDDQMLASLVMITRPTAEIRDMDEAAQWVGLPAFDGYAGDAIGLNLTFDTEAQREEVAQTLGLMAIRKGRRTWSASYPPVGRADPSSVIFDG